MLFYQKINISVPDEVDLDDVIVHGPYATTVTRKLPVTMQPKYFPFFMIGISAIQVAFTYFLDNEFMTLLFGYDPHRRYEIWRYFTYAFVHARLSHLWTNMLLQMILGILLEIVHHCKRISVIYFASVLGGSLFITVLRPRQYVIGASGGVYGLLFSHLSTIILNWNQMDRKLCRLFWLVLYIVWNFSLQIIMKDLNISIACHLGGAVTGFLVSILVLKNFEKHPWEKKMQKICLGALIALFVIIIINVTSSGLYLPTEWNFNYVKTYEDFTVNLVAGSAQDSIDRKQCQLDLKCMTLMLRRNVSVT